MPLLGICLAIHSCSVIVVNTDFFRSTFGEIHVLWDWKELNKPLDPDPVDLEDVQAEIDELSTSRVNTATSLLLRK